MKVGWVHGDQSEGLWSFPLAQGSNDEDADVASLTRATFLYIRYRTVLNKRQEEPIMIWATSIQQSPPVAADLAASTDMFPEILRMFRELLRECFDSYRPERHYMRGRGPKWHELHDGLPLEHC
jgi:hypothetical protein